MSRNPYLDDNGVATCEGRCDLPGPHEQGEVPGHNGTDHTHRLVQGVAEEVAVHRDCLTADLVCPASKVAEVLDDQGQVSVDGPEQRLAVVQSADYYATG